jgi:histone deacetylase complex regulatory component SIN3
MQGNSSNPAQARHLGGTSKEIMKITSVTYTRLQTLQGYNNERVGATADIENDMPEQAMSLLKAWVHEQLSHVEDNYDMQEDIQRLGYRKDELQRNINHLEARYEHLRNILQQHGVEIEDLDSIPF